ncbi:MAG: FliM/FliN family flagellar motor switch protein [Pseudomonadota bacterium]
MNVTPFLLLKRSRAEQLATSAYAALVHWGTAWATMPGSAVTCTAFSVEHRDLGCRSDWRQHVLSSGISVWSLAESGLARSIEQMLFQFEKFDATSEKHLPSLIASDVAQDAVQDLLICLINALTGTSSESTRPEKVPVLPALLFRPGSGAVLCTASLAEKTLWLLLPAEALPVPAQSRNQSSEPAAVRTSLSSLQQALAKVQIRLSVEVSQTEMTLGYLGTLAVGDVLALPASIDHVMRVSGPGDTTLCHAHIGTLEGFYAIELIK